MKLALPFSEMFLFPLLAGSIPSDVVTDFFTLDPEVSFDLLLLESNQISASISTFRSIPHLVPPSLKDQNQLLHLANNEPNFDRKPSGLLVAHCRQMSYDS